MGESRINALNYQSKNMVKPVSFFLNEPEAKEVYVIGDFNDWEAGPHPMQRQPDGTWKAEILLPHGHHHYTFYVDGERRLDSRAQGIARNEKNERVSLLSVS